MCGFQESAGDACHIDEMCMCVVLWLIRTQGVCVCVYTWLYTYISIYVVSFFPQGVLEKNINIICYIVLGQNYNYLLRSIDNLNLSK